MARTGKAPRDLLAAKGDKLNWSLFHFLENLLVFCAMELGRLKLGWAKRVEFTTFPASS